MYSTSLKGLLIIAEDLARPWKKGEFGPVVMGARGFLFSRTCMPGSACNESDRKTIQEVLFESRLSHVPRFVRRCAVAYTVCFAVPSNCK
jgi:hypothetical protein